MLGGGRDRAHHRIDHRRDIIPRVALDDMCFTDCGITKTLEEAHELIEQHQGDVREVQPALVMKDYARGSVWAYPVDGKGMAASPFIAEMILSDLDSCGLGSAQIVSKTDQEPAIVEVQGEISKLRREVTTAGTAEEHSRVGDSSSNG